MRDTAERTEQVIRRVRVLRKQRERRIIHTLAAVSTALSGCLILLIARATGPGNTMVSGMYGSLLVRSDVGGYVLTGLMTFTVAVFLTLACIQYKQGHNGKDDER